MGNQTFGFWVWDIEQKTGKFAVIEDVIECVVRLKGWWAWHVKKLNDERWRKYSNENQEQINEVKKDLQLDGLLNIFN